MKLHRGNFESNIAFLRKLTLLQTPQKILEIGSGRGALVYELQKMGHKAVGTEVNDEYMEYAKSEYGVELIRIDTETTSLPFPDKSFDVVVSFDVFEHIPDTESHVKEVRRVLTDSGSYILGTPNKWTNIPFEIIKEKSFTKYKEYHCSLHNYWQIQKRFRNLNFTITFLKVPIVTAFFLEKIKKYFGTFGLILVEILKPDTWPQWMRTNFYVIATKK